MPLRPIISYFLIGVLLLNTVGFLAVHSTLKYLHRNEVDVALALPAKKKVYESLHVTQQEFEAFVWRRPRKEFERNQALYDVVTFEYVGDSVFIVCYKDHKEMKMDAVFANVIHTQSDTSHSKKSFATYLLQPFIHESSYYFSAQQTDFRRERKDYFHYAVHLSSPDLTIHSPPPQVFRFG